MAIAFVQKTPTGTTTPASTNATSLVLSAFGTQPTAGNHIAAVCTWYGSSTTMTCADNQGGSSYSTGKEQALTGNTGNAKIFYRENITTGASFVVTFTASVSDFIAGGAIEFSGVATSSSLGPTNSAICTSSCGAINSGSVTPSGNAVYIGAACNDGNSFWTGAAPSTGTELWTLQANTVMTHASTYNISSGAYSAQWTQSDADIWTAAIASFNEAGGGGGTVGSGPLLAGARNRRVVS